MQRHIKFFTEEQGNLEDQSDENKTKHNKTLGNAMTSGIHMQSASCTKGCPQQETGEEQKNPDDNLKINLIDYIWPKLI